MKNLAFVLFDIVSDVSAKASSDVSAKASSNSPIRHDHRFKRNNLKCLIFKKNLLDFIDKEFVHEVVSFVGDLPSLKYLHKNGHPFDKYGMSVIWAAAGGFLDIVKYLHSIGMPFHYDAITLAAWNGHFNVVKYLHSNGCKLISNATAYSALGGHLEIVKYLHENGCYWSDFTFTYAIRSGNVEIIKYVIDNGCRKDILYGCSSHGGLVSVSDYLMINDYKWNASKTKYYISDDKYLEIEKYLREIGFNVEKKLSICFT